jgi:hypothetical protein
LTHQPNHLSSIIVKNQPFTTTLTFPTAFNESKTAGGAPAVWITDSMKKDQRQTSTGGAFKTSSTANLVFIMANGPPFGQDLDLMA